MSFEHIEQMLKESGIPYAKEIERITVKREGAYKITYPMVLLPHESGMQIEAWMPPCVVDEAQVPGLCEALHNQCQKTVQFFYNKEYGMPVAGAVVSVRRGATQLQQMVRVCDIVVPLFHALRLNKECNFTAMINLGFRSRESMHQA